MEKFEVLVSSLAVIVIEKAAIMQTSSILYIEEDRTTPYAEAHRKGYNYVNL